MSETHEDTDLNYGIVDEDTRHVKIGSNGPNGGSLSEWVGYTLNLFSYSFLGTTTGPNSWADFGDQYVKRRVRQAERLE